MKSTLVSLALISIMLAGCVVEPGGEYGNRGYGDRGHGDREQAQYQHQNDHRQGGGWEH